MEVNLNMSQGEKTNFPHKVGHDPLFEMKRKIEVEKDKFWIKVFGGIISYIPFVAPSPDQIYKMMIKISGDVGTMAQGANEINLIKEPSLSFLLGIESEFKKNNFHQ